MTSATSHALALALGALLAGVPVWLWRDKVAAQRAAVVAHVRGVRDTQSTRETSV